MGFVTITKSHFNVAKSFKQKPNGTDFVTKRLNAGVFFLLTSAQNLCASAQVTS
jgi:hypothetical protein